MPHVYALVEIKKCIIILIDKCMCPLFRPSVSREQTITKYNAHFTDDNDNILNESVFMSSLSSGRLAAFSIFTNKSKQIIIPIFLDFRKIGSMTECICMTQMIKHDYNFKLTLQFRRLQPFI